jgi:hypothetical protein
MSLPNRILRMLNEKPATMTADAITTYFAAYRATYIAQVIVKLRSLGLIESDDVGRMSCTPSGYIAATLAVPARFSEPRRARFQPIPATNAR